ncbi:MAG: hypothetical protein LBK72_02585 [Bifidobacteriaceae bacterium]|nr:hypothetical protein [Bifidobacteriaceae bacterium]
MNEGTVRQVETGPDAVRGPDPAANRALLRSAPHPTSKRRTLSLIGLTARLYTVNWWSYAGLPALFLGALLAVTFSYAVVDPSGAAPEGFIPPTRWMTPSVAVVYWVLFATAFRAISGVSRFAFAVGGTRRTCYWGTLAFFAGVDLAWSALLTVGGVIERASPGWGRRCDTYFFPCGEVISWQGYFLDFFGTGALLVAVAYWLVECHRRWRARGLVIAGILATALVSALASTLVHTPAWLRPVWDAIGGVISKMNPDLGGLVTLGIAMVIAASIWPVMRRTSP